MDEMFSNIVVSMFLFLSHLGDEEKRKWEKKKKKLGLKTKNKQKLHFKKNPGNILFIKKSDKYMKSRNKKIKF